MKIEIVFGKVLKSLRAEHGVSQEELAYRANLDRTYISMLERGIHQPTLGSLVAVSDALNIRPSELLKIFEAELEKINNSE
ncbi:helix-turn-helix transcriptional regulator [Paenibacillus hemerocallicola]|uniref:Helix-turn-helix transcriptional regulator n=1 Tax=Paenibacillus hemerocallicola TaxID=1172614 RepID=A0A5C4T4S7_9BACL|nr:helix-turn-helix transcriptional regulator [Paenibacillus hemerocallicola]TNJ64033.1 helix-turn-helix transcriptional regulator [Paenibacillus hemerocallicola]